ncbi:MAG: sulfotransferase domain-containing protein [Parachlamydiaceae bacterium]|nr:sulfotransferase domain-containing protein [Parachlamydiaceae bacterium]
MFKLKFLIKSFLFLLILTIPFKNFCFSEDKDKIFLTTIPKSGTHLMIKLFVIMTEKNPSNIPGLMDYSQFFRFYKEPQSYQKMFPLMTKLINYSYENKMFPVVHTNFAEPILEYFLESKQKFKKFIMIRDLRDVIISAVFYQHDIIEQHIGPSTIEEKITYLLTLKNSDQDRYIIITRKYAQKALKLMEDDSFFVCRFEDLVGEKGGGDKELQAKTIVDIANHLKYPLDDEQLEKIIDELFGNETGPKISVTFKDGQIGKWRNYFTEEHNRIFKERMGELQLKLGYTLD